MKKVEKGHSWFRQNQTTIQNTLKEAKILLTKQSEKSVQRSLKTAR